MIRKSKIKKEKLYSIVTMLRASPKQTSRNKQHYNFYDPTALRALRIHRHLRALEQEILNQAGNRSILLELDPISAQIVITIRNDEIHCNRVAYLTPQEFSILRKNRKVANILKKCCAWKDVA